MEITAAHESAACPFSAASRQPLDRSGSHLPGAGPVIFQWDIIEDDKILISQEQ